MPRGQERAWVTSSRTGEFRCRHSRLESRRFGVSVGRLTVPFGSDADGSLPTVRELLATSRDDVVILRYPSERVTWFASAPRRGTGPRPRGLACSTSSAISAGSRPTCPHGPSIRNLSLVDGRDVDSSALVDLVPRVFATSHSHYTANPLFDPRATRAGLRRVGAHLVPSGPVCRLDDRASTLWVPHFRRPRSRRA